ncbi:MAG: hypothetical protein D6738_04235 [Acidobacteria bacterium]|nr:MAG: hypothetical protein D6738_04235 [Acidobacteriota bacterium]
MPGFRHAAVALVAACLALGAGDALAFSPGTRALVVQRAMTLMPGALRRQMTRHAPTLFAHALAGSERVGPGYSALDPGDADVRLEQAIEAAVQAVDTQRPMREVVARFGDIARITTDLSFALNVGPDDPRESGFYTAFARYIESRHDRIRVTFLGFADPDLAAGDIRGFARRIAGEARRDYEAIVASYHPPGRQPLAEDFDDRSVAFAVASLEVSLAVTATARAWLCAWHRAHGDLAGAPVSDPRAPFAPAGTAPDVASSAGRRGDNGR